MTVTVIDRTKKNQYLAPLQGTFLSLLLQIPLGTSFEKYLIQILLALPAANSGQVHHYWTATDKNSTSNTRQTPIILQTNITGHVCKNALITSITF